MSRHRLCLVLAAATSLGGCAALSEYDGMDDLVPKLFKQIKCEIYKSKQKDGPNPKSILSRSEEHTSDSSHNPASRMPSSA
jgi:hypothetical protein